MTISTQAASLLLLFALFGLGFILVEVGTLIAAIVVTLWKRK